MDWNSLMQVVGTLGFPIVMCVVLCYYIKLMTDKFQQQIEKISEQRLEEQKEHKEEILKLSEIINNNTLAIQELSDRLSLRKEE